MLQTESELWNVADHIHCLVEEYPALREELMETLAVSTDAKAVQQRYGSKNSQEVSKNAEVLSRVMANKPQARNHLNKVRQQLTDTSYEPNEPSNRNRLRGFIHTCLTTLQHLFEQNN